VKIEVEKILKKKVWIYKYKNMDDMLSHMKNMITAGFKIEKIDCDNFVAEISQVEELE